MGKKSKNNNKNKKGKENDDRGSSTSGDSSSNNNNNNNTHHNNFSIPTVDETVPVVATTTTMGLSQMELDYIDNSECKFKGYPKSNDFFIGAKLVHSDQYDLATDSYKRGAHDGCVPCMFSYAEFKLQAGNMHSVVPIALEGAVRGHVPSMNILIECYQHAKPVRAMALISFWAKSKIEFGEPTYTEEKRKAIKNKVADICYVCGKKESEDNNDVTLVKCGICKYYSYCGKNCQTRHWKKGKHMHECRQVILLRKYCKPSYVKEIRDAIFDGQDPKEMHTLQRLRMKLGLNRPTEEYEELLLHLDSNNNNITKPGTKVKVKGLVKASVHNGKIGTVTKVGSSSIPGEEYRRVEVKLSDDNGGTVVVAIKIKNLELNHLNPHLYLVGKKDGTVHIGSTPNVI